jgi:hypothetical protein
MRVFADWDIPDELRNELLRHLHEFEVIHPNCQFTAFVQEAPAVPLAAFLREPSSSVTRVPGHRPSGPQLSPFERAMEAVLENPGRPARVIAKQIGISHQTVLRARAALRSATAPTVVQGRNHGPHGPRGGRR